MVNKPDPNKKIGSKLAPRGFVSFPVPFSDGRLGSLYLPPNLTLKEAKRISEQVLSLAFDDEVHSENDTGRNNG